MSLECCATCGYALAIADGHCRHCANTGQATTSTLKILQSRLLLPIVSAAFLVAALVYRIFFS